MNRIIFLFIMTSLGSCIGKQHNKCSDLRKSAMQRLADYHHQSRNGNVDLALALVEINNSLSCDSTEILSYYVKIQILKELGNVNQILSVFNALEPYELKGKFYLAKADYFYEYSMADSSKFYSEKAYKEFTSYLKNHPNNFDYHMFQIEAIKGYKGRSEAIQEAKKMIALFPLDSVLLRDYILSLKDSINRRDTVLNLFDIPQVKN